MRALYLDHLQFFGFPYPPMVQAASLAPLNAKNDVISVLFEEFEFHNIRVMEFLKNFRFESQCISCLLLVGFVHDL